MMPVRATRRRLAPLDMADGMEWFRTDLAQLQAQRLHRARYADLGGDAFAVVGALREAAQRLEGVSAQRPGQRAQMASAHPRIDPVAAHVVQVDIDPVGRLPVQQVLAQLCLAWAVAQQFPVLVPGRIERLAEDRKSTRL